ncbi:hypothetical protein AAC387_Pa01g2745 [Persea americana]
MASLMSVDNPIALNSFKASKVRKRLAVEIGQRTASRIEVLGLVQTKSSDGQSHRVGSVSSSTEEGRSVIEVGKILVPNFGPNENAILHHISQIEKEELAPPRQEGSDKKTRGDAVDRTA